MRATTIYDPMRAARELLWADFPAHTYLVIDPTPSDSPVLELETECGRIVADSLLQAEVLLLRGVDTGIYPSGCLLVEMLPEGDEEIELTEDDLEIIFQ